MLIREAKSIQAMRVGNAEGQQIRFGQACIVGKSRIGRSELL